MCIDRTNKNDVSNFWLYVHKFFFLLYMSYVIKRIHEWVSSNGHTALGLEIYIYFFLFLSNGIYANNVHEIVYYLLLVSSTHKNHQLTSLARISYWPKNVCFDMSNELHTLTITLTELWVKQATGNQSTDETIISFIYIENSSLVTVCLHCGHKLHKILDGIQMWNKYTIPKW